MAHVRLLFHLFPVRRDQRSDQQHLQTSEYDCLDTLLSNHVRSVHSRGHHTHPGGELDYTVTQLHTVTAYWLVSVE